MDRLYDKGEMDKFITRSKDAWRNFIRIDGIKAAFSPSNLKKELSKDRPKILNLLDSEIIVSPILINPVKRGATNYFLINNTHEAPICTKCNNYGIVVLIMDKKYLDNLDKKVFTPGLGAYIEEDIDINSPLFAKRFPIPINPETDYWFCPHCQKLHKFRFESDKGLIFDQEIVNL